jgi:hypothetical protein
MRKPDALAVGPVQHGGGQRTRLRHEGQLAGQGVARRKAGVQGDTGDQQTDAVRSQNAQQMRPARGQHGLLYRRAALTSLAHRLLQACRQHNGGLASLAAQCRDHFGNCSRRRADHRQIRHAGQRRDIEPGLLACYLAVVLVDWPQRALETCPLQIAQHDGAQAAGTLGNANDGHRGGRKQGFEVAYAHVNPCKDSYILAPASGLDAPRISLPGLPMAPVAPYQTQQAWRFTQWDFERQVFHEFIRHQPGSQLSATPCTA